MARLRGLYGALARAQVPKLAQVLAPGAPVFCFHNVASDGEVGPGDPSLHMAMSEFERVIAWIREAYEVVPLPVIRERLAVGQSLAGLAGLTFDDAYVGVLRNAIPHLRALGLPSTLFVVPDFAERPRPTWWDVMATRGSLTHQARERALSLHKGLNDDVIADLPRPPGSGELPRSFLPGGWDEVLAAAGSDVEIGSHTARHANLAVLASDALDEELVRSRMIIEDRTGKAPDSIAYPYGLVHDGVVEATARAGYLAGFTLEARPARSRRESPFALPRVNVPAGIPPEALECWAAGLNPNRWR